MVRIKLVFFKYELVVCLLYVGKVEVGLRDENRRIGGFYL
jgi:hypothetical protein